MIALAGLLVLVAGALLVGGLGNGQTTMLWGSVGVSALAAAALVLQSVRRARAARADAEDDDEPALVAAAAPAAGSVAAKTPAAHSPAAKTPAVGSTVAPPEAPAPVTAAEPADPPPAAAADSPAAAEAETVVTAAVPHTTAAAAPAQTVVPTPVEAPPTAAGPSTGSHHASRPPAGLDEDGEPVEEDVEVTDLLLTLDLTDEVEVVDEHPRYHLAGCSVTAGEEVFGLPLTEAKEDGFTACGICRPDRHLADAERRRRAAAKA